jgi:hypothetical protein
MAMKPKKMMRGGPAKKKSGGKLDMVEKDGKKVPFFAADGKGKMAKGGAVKKMMRGGPVKMMHGGPAKKMMRGGPVKEMAEGGMVSPRKKEAMGGKTKCRVRGVK